MTCQCMQKFHTLAKLNAAHTAIPALVRAEGGVLTPVCTPWPEGCRDITQREVSEKAL